MTGDAQKKTSASNTILRAIIAGMSGRATWALPTLNRRDDIEIVGLVDPVRAKVDYFAKEYGVENATRAATIEECLDKCECDVVVAVPLDATHADVVVPALEAGKYVFVDKPLETTWEKCKRIIQADHEAGGKTFVGHNMRYAPVYTKVHELVRAGVVGDILTLQTDEFYSGGRTYFRRWNRLREFGGGLWITKACHDWDALNWIAGARPVAITAAAHLGYYRPKPEAAMRCRDCKIEPDCPDSYRHHCGGNGARLTLAETWEKEGGPVSDLCLYNSDKDTFDHGSALIEYDGGITAVYTCNLVAGFSTRRLRVSGTKGTVDGDHHENRVVLRRRDPAGTEEFDVSKEARGGHGGADRYILDDFLAFARGERAPECRPEEAALAVRVGLAARLASDEHRRVLLEEIG